MTESLRLNPAIAPDDEKEDLQKTVKAQARRYDRFMATGRLSVGAIWNSNATCGLDNLDIEIGGYDFHLPQDAEKKSAFAEYLQYESELELAPCRGLHLASRWNPRNRSADRKGPFCLQRL